MPGRPLITVLGVLCIGCGIAESGPPHKYIVPDGYRGFFRIEVDAEKGEGPELVDGEYVFRIPASGVLTIADRSPFEQWHASSAAYASGTPLPTEYEAAPEEVALYSFLTSNSYDFLVGTEDDQHKAYTIGWPRSLGPLPEEPIYSTSHDAGITSYRKNGRLHGIETWFDGGEIMRQEQWIRGKLVALRKEPPWFTEEEIAEARR